MKSILLASASIIAFAGVAAADGHSNVSLSGSVDLGFNDTDIDNDGNDSVAGFYSDLDITANLSAELDNGMTAAASIDLEDLVTGSSNGVSYELSLTSATSGLYYGDTNFAAQNVWVAAGPMAADNFSEADGEEALRSEMTFGNVSAQMSYALADSAGVRNTGDALEQLSLGVAADFGNVNVVAAYQSAFSNAVDGAAYAAANGDITDADIFGLSVGTTMGGADVRLAYADNGTEDSIGVSVGYTTGPVTINAGYAKNSVSIDQWDLSATYASGPMSITASTDEADDWGLEGSYDVGNGLTVFAGVVDAGEDFYVGGSYDLGGGASLLVSYADDGDADEADGDDDIGANDYQVGTTVEVSFAF